MQLRIAGFTETQWKRRERTSAISSLGLPGIPLTQLSERLLCVRHLLVHLAVTAGGALGGLLITGPCPLAIGSDLFHARVSPQEFGFALR